MSVQTGLGAVLLALFALLRIADPAFVAGIRASLFDSYQQLSPRMADPDYPVKIIAIDEASLKRFGQWPWPRTRLAELVDKLNAAGVSAVAFDLILAEADRMSPAEIAKALPVSAAAKAFADVAGRLPANDAVLAGALAKAPSVLGVAGDPTVTTKIDPPRASLAFTGDNPAEFVPAFPGGVPALPVLGQSARGLGAVNWLPSRDQIVRRVPLLVSIGGTIYPSLSLETLRIAAGQSTILVKSSGGSGLSAFGQKTGVETIRVGEVILPTDAGGELWLHFAASNPRRTISAETILGGDRITLAELKGKIAVIGATATGLLDIRATPLDSSVPGVEVHAQALEQMLSGAHLERPAYASGAELLFLLGLGGVVVWLIGRVGPMIAATAGAAAIALVGIGSWLAFTQGGLLFDPVYPALAVTGIYLATSLFTYVRSELERNRVRAAFGHYLAPALVDQLAANPEKLKLGGEMREVTLLFADVRGFTRIAERLKAEDLVQFINRLFEPMTEIILDEKGTVDKFMGDAVMAFWNAPLDDPDHAKNACRAAQRMIIALRRLNVVWAVEAEANGETFEPVRLGIGINTGLCCVGNMGSAQRFDYSVIGDPVNVASRLESETKVHGVPVIVGERTTALAGSEFVFLEIGSITPRGKAEAQKVFALS